jgi:hypothetical protein
VKSQAIADRVKWNPIVVEAKSQAIADPVKWNPIVVDLTKAHRNQPPNPNTLHHPRPLKV